VAIRLEEEDAPRLPSLLSAQEKFSIIGEQVKQIQAEMFRLEVVQRMNNHRESDLVPGSDQTYQAQLDAYHSGLKRIEVCYPDFIDLVLGAKRGI
jgi:hypothetical protein